MQVAALARPRRDVPRPTDVVEHSVDERTGMIVGDGRDGSHPELFRRRGVPPSKRWWRIDEPLEPIE